jgi:phosphatidylinositol glycan class U
MVFCSILAMLFGLSRLFLPSWNFVPAVFMTPLTLPDLTPNPGLWWYFFIEMFDAFREFFLGVFWLHMLSYSVPFALRFRRQPLAGILLMMGVIAVFQPYANAGDVGAWLSALCLLGHVFERKSNPSATCHSTRIYPWLHADCHF